MEKQKHKSTLVALVRENDGIMLALLDFTRVDSEHGQFWGMDFGNRCWKQRDGYEKNIGDRDNDSKAVII